MSGHKDTAAARPRAETDARRDLLLLRAGGRRFAVFADEADGVAQGSKHAPLPHAPRAVLGVASVDDRRGVLLAVQRPGNKERRALAEQLWADDGASVNATVLDDYRSWVDRGGLEP